MAHIWSKAKAPGSLMLFGEHAVLYKKQALVMAVDQYIHVDLMPRNDDKILIHSALGQHKTTIEALNSEASKTSPLKFVLTAITTYVSKLNKGFALKIQSDFSHALGLGSSAAVVVAVLRVLSKCYDDIPLVQTELFKAAKKVIEEVQGLGSGADVAASVFGGLVQYCAEPLLIKPIKVLPPVTVVYSGYKTATPEVIRQVQAKFADKPSALELIYNDMETCTKNAILALGQEDWKSLGQEMNVAQQWMINLGVSDEILEQKIAALRRDPNIFGAKISGAGLGDCVIGLGKATGIFSGQLAVEPSLHGVCDAA